MTRFVRKLDLALEIRDLTKLHWALNFLRSKGDFQRRHDRLSRLLSHSATRISGLIHGVWGLRTTIQEIDRCCLNMSLSTQCDVLSSLCNYHWNAYLKAGSNEVCSNFHVLYQQHLAYQPLENADKKCVKYKPCSLHNRFIRFSVGDMYSLDRERLLLFAFKPADDNVEHLDEQRRLPPTGTQQPPVKRVRTNAITRRIRTSAELEGHRRRVETAVSNVRLDNSVFKKNLFTHYEATVIEVGSVFWRYHSENKDVFVLSDIDDSGELMPSHFVHCEREQLDEMIVYTCSCEAFELMRSNFLLPADNDVEDDEIEGVCIHSRFVDKNVACHINSILNGIDTNSSDTALVGKLKTSKTFLNLGVVPLFRSGTVSKFSVLPRDSDAYSLVSILNDTITCHSCLCEVKLYNKRSKKVTLRLDDAARICPHLEAMRAHQEVWVHGANDGDGEEIGDDETGTDEANIPLSDMPPVEENAPIPRDTRKHFNIQTGLWDFGGYSKHVPAEKNRPSLEQLVIGLFLFTNES